MTPQQPSQIIMPQAPTPPPVFASTPLGQKPGTKSQTPTYLGSGTMPSQSNQGFKTLIGQ